MQIITWNIRGLGSSVKKRFLSKLIKRRKPSMVCVQETKLEFLDRIAVLKLWGNSDVDFACSSAVGASGGLLTIWCKEFFRAESVISHRSFILMQGVINGDFPCIFVNVYAPNDVVDRRGVWDELLRLKGNSQIPWCMGGDFNEIRAPSERVGCSSMERGMRDFVEFCNNMELEDLPMLGRKYTWTNYQDQAILSRLDRFLMSQQWIQQFKVLQ